MCLSMTRTSNLDPVLSHVVKIYQPVKPAVFWVQSWETVVRQMWDKGAWDSQYSGIVSSIDIAVVVQRHWAATA